MINLRLLNIRCLSSKTFIVHNLDMCLTETWVKPEHYITFTLNDSPQDYYYKYKACLSVTGPPVGPKNCNKTVGNKTVGF